MALANELIRMISWTVSQALLVQKREKSDARSFVVFEVSFKIEMTLQRHGIRSSRRERQPRGFVIGQCFLAIAVVFSIAWFIVASRSLKRLQGKQKAQKVEDKQQLPSHIEKQSTEQAFDKYRYRYRPPQPRSEYDPKNECGMSPDFSPFFRLSDAVRSFRNEDKNIYGLFFLSLYEQRTASHKNFTYVELGAFNGLRESNTRFFDVCLEWTGLLIEANPLKYPKLLSTRPHAHCLNYAPSCTDKEEIGFHSVSFTNAAQASVPSFYDKDNSSLVQVPCDSLTPAIVDLLGGYVTFFSLDVEGAEALILKTVDFDKVHVDIWMVEYVNHFCPKDQNCRSRDESHAILQRAGYVGYKKVVLGSTVFVKPHSIYWKILESRFSSNRLSDYTFG